MSFQKTAEQLKSGIQQEWTQIPVKNSVSKASKRVIKGS